MKRLRLAFVLPSLHGGGAERAAVTILNTLPAGTYDRSLYLFARQGAYLDGVDRGVAIVSPEGRRGRLGRLMALRHWLTEHRPDVVVSFLSYFTVFAAVRASGCRARYVISQQTPLSAFLEDADYHWRLPVQRRVFTTAARTVYPRADLVTATSQGVADDLVAHYGVSAERVAILHNPVDIEAVAAKAAEPIDPALADDPRPVIVSAGRLADAKNLPLLIASLRLLATRLDFRAWLLGQGELEARVRQDIAAAGLADRVSLLGFQSNPWKFMAAADVFLLTSRYEGFGNVLIEAMASGLPVVATASVGTREIVRHGQTGVLVEAHEPSAVASALESVLTSPDRRRRLASCARVAAREFGTDVVARRMDGLLQALCA